MKRRDTTLRASLSNHDGNGNDNVKKKIAFIEQNNGFARAFHTLVHFFLRWIFCFSNWTWAVSLRNQLPDSSATLDNLNELE